MIRDLLGAGEVRLSIDVLVVGGGTAGLILATELATQGVRVICLESGGKEQASETHPLNTVEQAGAAIYAGAEHGRVRCLGGTSTRWGGALIPFQAADLRPVNWPITLDELAPWVERVEALFGLPDGPYEDESVPSGADFVARLAKWPSFTRRNVYSLLRDKIESDTGPDVWLNATVTEFTVSSGCLSGVVARAPDGARVSVTAAQVVLAAGAIESTRLLLLLDRQNAACVSEVTRFLGEGFHDHLSATVAEMVPLERKALNQLVGFRFSRGGGMRNLRFELAPNSTLRRTVPPCFAHVGFTEDSRVFSALRDLFRALQRRRLPSPSVIHGILRGLPWLFHAIWWRFAKRRLLYPDQAKLMLHMVIEQGPRSENRISLSGSSVDAFGQPLASIEWEIAEADISAMKRATEEFVSRWEQGPLARLANIRPLPPRQVAEEMSGCGGIYHPGGSTRMAATSSEGVVDSDLRVFGVRNLRVCATSVLPTGGGANPTMMLLLLTLRCADQLTSLLKTKSHA